MTETELQALLDQLLTAVATKPRDGHIGYQGPATPLRTGVYFEYKAASGQLLVVDNEHLAQTGTVALREWITLRGGRAGGRESVRPGGSSVGGIGIPALLQLLGLATGVPLLGGLGGIGSASPAAPRTTEEAIGSLVMGLLKGKVARYGGEE